MEFDALMKCLADEVGIPEGFVADEEGVVRIGAGEGGSIAFAEVRELQSMLIWSRVCDLPAHGAERLKDGLLRANFMGQTLPGGVFSLSEDNGVYLHRLFPLPLLDGDGFVKEVTAFMGNLLNWRRMTQDYAAGDFVREDSADPKDGTDRSGFVRV